MAIVYVVIENGELYPILYKTYESALPPFGRLLWSLRDHYPDRCHFALKHQQNSCLLQY
jgi:hypothetical protein